MTQIVTRAQWGARPARPSGRNTVTWANRTEFYVHHTDGPRSQSIKSIQDFHLDGRGWGDIGYNFLVRDDGTIYEGRGWLVVGAHCPDHNRSGIGVAFIGSNNPTEAAKRSIRWLYDEACRRSGRTLAKRFHGQSFPTECPGSELRAWVKAGMPAEGSSEKPTPEKAPAFPGRLLRYPPMTHGSDVYTWQARMRDRGWDLIPDGAYGPRSREVCLAFQRDSTAHGWPLDDDGIVGAATWRAAFERPVS